MLTERDWWILDLNRDSAMAIEASSRFSWSLSVALLAFHVDTKKAGSVRAVIVFAPILDNTAARFVLFLNFDICAFTWLVLIFSDINFLFT
jgi:hypothetical protein